MALDFLESRTASPLYEMMLPFGAYAAARLNAANTTGAQYDVAKLVGLAMGESVINCSRLSARAQSQLLVLLYISVSTCRWR